MNKLQTLLLTLCALLVCSATARADKGMWVLSELNEQNEARMRELGFNLSLDQLYNLDQPSIARGVVIFGGGCTGITVSDQGLLFTNHHCGYDAIQSQSTVEHDYLRDGFASQSFREELPIPGLSVKYLRAQIDVTARIEQAVAGITDEAQRQETIDKVSEEIVKEYTKSPFDAVEVTPFYAGNKYYVVIYDEFKDVRLVMTPPSSVGKFGGDTDNWMWPRHTGDFSVFRVYADANNQPAEYAASNKPYRPVYYTKVSLQGYQEQDYAMTIGFPGSTDRYLTSYGVIDRIENENAPRIEARGVKQEIWKRAMEADQATRIKYASKYAQSSNYWKNSIGMNRGLEKLHVVDRKRAEEEAFTQWVARTGKPYGNILPDLKRAYEEAAPYNRQLNYIVETMLSGSEIVWLGYQAMVAASSGNKEELEGLYKDYLPNLDREVLPAMLALLRTKLPADNLPFIYQIIDERFGGDYKAYAEELFANSVVPYEDKMMAVLAMDPNKVKETLANDPVQELVQSVLMYYSTLINQYMEYNHAIEKGKRELFAAMSEFQPNALRPSDANFTMRMSYGRILGYEPGDGAWYYYFTTERGVFQKQNPNSTEFAVQPEILKLLSDPANFAPYGVGNHLFTCFLSDNDITGGNSGSPVFDKNGNLIGLAFDGNWEAMSGDIEFEPDLQRTISVDIRYVLFMIDKWAKCPRLIQELTFA